MVVGTEFAVSTTPMIVTYRQVTESDCEMETSTTITWVLLVLQRAGITKHAGPYTRVDELAGHKRISGCKAISYLTGAFPRLAMFIQKNREGRRYCNCSRCLTNHN